jgi:ADP-dependent NAD(P)H-hydrate dehydratase / NAD(P)H-hydrate epimerase
MIWLEKNEMKLVAVEEMRAIEEQAQSAGMTYENLMENAGKGLAEVILENFTGGSQESEAFGLIGPGNNGGDTLIALEKLAVSGWRARAYLVKRKPDELVKRLAAAGGEIFQAEEDKGFNSLEAFLETSEVILDGLLGTGIKLPLKTEIGEVLSAVSQILNKLLDPPFVVAVDCPSGIDCDSGAAAPECIPADLTVTMAAAKQGLLKLPAFEYVGELHIVDIGLPADLPAWVQLKAEVAEPELVAACLPGRPVDAHKGTFGTAMIVAGSVNYTGAALLAGKAAYRGGAGLVTMAIPASLHTALAGQFPEATWELLPHEQGVIAREAAENIVKNLDRTTALLIGPGFGVQETTREFLEDLLQGNSAHSKAGGRVGFLQEQAADEEKGITLPPLVIDADGLKLLAKIKEWPKFLSKSTILTPHPGEMSVMTGLSVEKIQADRRGTAEKYAAEWGHVVVLKGAFTLIAAPDGRLTTVPVASPALARAGTGDVLAGLIVGLRAQGLEAYQAAVAGAWIHAQAGLLAAEDLGGSISVLAGDVLEAIPEVLSGLS